MCDMTMLRNNSMLQPASSRGGESSGGNVVLKAYDHSLDVTMLTDVIQVTMP